MEKRDLQLWDGFPFFYNVVFIFNSALNLIKGPIQYFIRIFHRPCSLNSLNSKDQWVGLFSMMGHSCPIGHHAWGGGAVTWSGWVMELAQLLREEAGAASACTWHAVHCWGRAKESLLTSDDNPSCWRKVFAYLLQGVNHSVCSVHFRKWKTVIGIQSSTYGSNLGRWHT